MIGYLYARRMLIAFNGLYWSLPYNKDKLSLPLIHNDFHTHIIISSQVFGAFPWRKKKKWSGGEGKNNRWSIRSICPGAGSCMETSFQTITSCICEGKTRRLVQDDDWSFEPRWNRWVACAELARGLPVRRGPRALGGNRQLAAAGWRHHVSLQAPSGTLAPSFWQKGMHVCDV